MAQQYMTDQELTFDVPAGLGRWTITPTAPHADDWVSESLWYDFSDTTKLTNSLYSLQIQVETSLQQVKLIAPQIPLPNSNYLKSLVFQMYANRQGGNTQLRCQTFIKLHRENGTVLQTSQSTVGTVSTGAGWFAPSCLSTFPTTSYSWDRVASFTVEMVFFNNDGTDIPVGTSIHIDGDPGVCSLIDYTPGIPGPPEKTFYALQTWGYDDTYVCEWKIENDTPVHVRHQHLSSYPGNNFYAWTTWVTKHYLYVFGWDTKLDDNDFDADTSVCWKIRRHDFANLGQVDVADKDIGGSPGGVTNVDGYAWLWQPYWGSNPSPWLGYITEEEFPDYNSDAVFNVDPSMSGFQTHTWGDIGYDGLVVWGTYGDSYIRRGNTNQTPSVDLFNVDLLDIPYLFVDDTFESGSLGVWTVKQNCTLTNVAITGPGGQTRSLSINMTGGDAEIQSPSYVITEMGRPEFEMRIPTRTSSGTRTIVFYQDYYDINGNFLGRKGGTSDVFGTTWETRTLGAFQSPYSNSHSVRFIIQIQSAASGSVYIDYVQVSMVDAGPNFDQEPLKINPVTRKGYLNLDMDGVFYPTSSPSAYPNWLSQEAKAAMNKVHTWALLEFDLDTGTVTNYWPIDYQGNDLGIPVTMGDNDAAGGGLVLTPDYKHLVAAQQNYDGYNEYEGMIVCRNLETGAMGWASTPHGGYWSPENSTLIHIGAYHDLRERFLGILSVRQ